MPACISMASRGVAHFVAHPRLMAARLTRVAHCGFAPVHAMCCVLDLPLLEDHSENGDGSNRYSDVALPAV